MLKTAEGTPQTHPFFISFSAVQPLCSSFCKQAMLARTPIKCRRLLQKLLLLGPFSSDRNAPNES